MQQIHVIEHVALTGVGRNIFTGVTCNKTAKTKGGRSSKKCISKNTFFFLSTILNIFYGALSNILDTVLTWCNLLCP